MTKAQKIMQKKKFLKEKASAAIPDKIEKVWQDAIKRLDGYFSAYPDLPKGVRTHTDSYIFPAAAFYLALKEETPDAYDIVAEAMKEQASQMGSSLQRMSRIPGFKAFFLWVWDPVSHKMFGESSGFKNVFYPKQKREYRMDIVACPYNRYLTELGCPELTVLFCKNDEYTYGNIPGLDFIRTQTLGAGGEKCDFKLMRR